MVPVGNRVSGEPKKRVYSMHVIKWGAICISAVIVLGLFGTSLWSLNNAVANWWAGSGPPVPYPEVFQALATVYWRLSVVYFIWGVEVTLFTVWLASGRRSHILVFAVLVGLLIGGGTVIWLNQAHVRYRKARMVPIERGGRMLDCRSLNENHVPLLY